MPFNVGISDYLPPFLVSSDWLSLIDMEYGGVNYRGYDIADHACEFAGKYVLITSVRPPRAACSGLAQVQQCKESHLE